jgi:deoxyribodipyrimidine photolyase
MILTTPSGTLSNLQHNTLTTRIPMPTKPKNQEKETSSIIEILEKEKRFEAAVAEYGHDHLRAEVDRRREAACNGDDATDKTIEDYFSVMDGTLKEQFNTTRGVFKARLKNWRKKVWPAVRAELADQLSDLESKRAALASDLEAVSRKHGVPVVVPDHFEGRINTKRYYLHMTPETAELEPIRVILS